MQATTINADKLKAHCVAHITYTVTTITSYNVLFKQPI